MIRSAEGLERLRRLGARSSRGSSPRARSPAARAAAAHFRSDFPTEDEAFAGHVVLEPGREPGLERWS